MDEKKVKELLRDLVDSARAAIDLIDEKAMFGDDQESEYFMPVMNSNVYYNLEQAVFRVLDNGVLEEKESNGDPHRNASESPIPDLYSYILEEFRKAEDDQANEVEIGYFTGKYMALKRLVESDEFKKLEGLVEKKEESNESV